MTMLERLALSVGMSLTAVGVVGTIITRGSIGLDQLSISIEVISLTFFFSGYALYRRSRLPRGEQFTLTISRVPRSNLNGLEKGVVALIALSMVVLATVSLDSMTSKPTSGPNTEFYILGPAGTLASLPQNISAGSTSSIQIDVVNHASVTMQYDLIVGMDGNGNYSAISGFDIASPVTLTPNEGMMTSFDVAPGGSYTAMLKFSTAVTGQHVVFFDLNDGVSVKQLWAQVNVVG